MTIKGGQTETTKLSAGNIGVVANGADTLEIKLSKEIKGIDSVVLGTDATDTGTVALTTTGINAGSKQIKNLASGMTKSDGSTTTELSEAVGTNAVNISDLKKVEDKIAASQSTEKVKAGDDLVTVSPKEGEETFGKPGTEYVVGIDKNALAKELVNGKNGVDGVDGNPGTPAIPSTKETLEGGLELTYKANKTGAKTVSLKDGLDFTNGTMTVATIEDNGVVTFDLNDATKNIINNANSQDNSPFEYADDQGNSLVNIDGNYYTPKSLENTVMGKDANGKDVPYPAGTQLDDDGLPVDTDVAAITPVDADKVVIKAKTGPKFVTNIASNLPGTAGNEVDVPENQIIGEDGQVIAKPADDQDQTAYNNARDKALAKAKDAAEIARTLSENVVRSNAATVDDVLNAGWNLQGNGKAVDFVKPYDTVNFVDGDFTSVEVESNKDQNQNTIKVNIKQPELLAGISHNMPVVYTLGDGDERVQVVKEGNDWYKLVNGKIVRNQDGSLDESHKVIQGDQSKIIGSMHNVDGSTITVMKLANVGSSISDVEVTLADGKTSTFLDKLAKAQTATPNNAVKVSDLKSALDEVNTGTAGKTFGVKVKTSKADAEKETFATATRNLDDQVEVIGDGNILVSIDGTEAGKAALKVSLDDNITVGKAGEDGKPGVDGVIGVNGKDGSSVVISGKDGITITGPKGEDGKDGVSSTIAIAKGTAGIDGKNGKDGITRIVYDGHEVATLDDGLKFKANIGVTNPVANKLGSTVTIKGTGAEADKNYDSSNIKTKVSQDSATGNTEIEVMLAKELSVDKVVVGKSGADGVDGAIGINGKDGTSGIIKVELSSKGKDGTNGTNGLDGQDGLTRIIYEDKDGGKHTVATLDDGLKFKGDDATVISKKLNAQLDIIGGADKNKLSDDNIGVNANTDGKLHVKLAKDLVGLDTITLGEGIDKSVINKDGITITEGTKTVSLTESGLNNGGNKITNVGNGVLDSDAVNMGQLKDKSFGVKVTENGVEATATRKVDNTLDVTDDGNVKVSIDGTDPKTAKLKVALEDTITLGNTADKKVVIDGTTGKVAVGDSTTIENGKVTIGNIVVDKTTGINAGNLGISNVKSAILDKAGDAFLDKLAAAQGDKTTAKNAVNVSDLHSVSSELAGDITNLDKRISSNLENSPFEYADDQGDSLVKIGDDYYPSDVVVAKDGKVYPAGTQLDDDGLPVDTDVAAITPVDANQVVIKAKTGPKFVTNIKSTLLGSVDNAIPTDKPQDMSDEEFNNLKAGKAIQALTLSSTELHHVATVSDVLNAGWNLQGNGTAVDFVKPYDTVNFVDGLGTLVTVKTDDHLTNTIHFDIATDNTTTKITYKHGDDVVVKGGENGTDPNKFYALDENGKLDVNKVIEAKDVKSYVSAIIPGIDDGALGNTDSGTVNVQINSTLTEALERAAEEVRSIESGENRDGEALENAKAEEDKAQKAVDAAKLADGVKVATVQNVADAINNSGFTATTKIDGKNHLVKPGSIVNFNAGENISIKQEVTKDGNTTFTFALDNNITVGQKGEPGKDGQAGTPGTPGSITIIGEKGTNGVDGKPGTNGADGKNAEANIKVVNGVNGKPGVDGQDGITRIEYKDEGGQDHTIATLEDGLNFIGDDGIVIHKELNKTLDIKGGITADAGITDEAEKLENIKSKLTDGNIGVVKGTDGLEVKLAKDLTGLTSATFGSDLKIGHQENLPVLDKNGKAVLNEDKTPKTESGNFVTGLDNTTWNISNPTYVSGRAATEDQLKTVSDAINTEINKVVEGGLKFGANSGADVTNKLGSTVTIKGSGIKDDKKYSSANIKTKVTQKEGNTEIEVMLDKELTLDKVTVGQKGEPGKDGQPGTPGVDGTIGVAGANGKDGVTITATGKDGKDGADGHIIINHVGKDGVDGKDGKDAKADISVAKGADGLDGNNGEDGMTRIIYEDENNGKHEVATLDDGLKFVGDDGNEIAKKLNQTLGIKGGVTDESNLTDGNIGVVNKDGHLEVKLAKDLKDLNSVSVGNPDKDKGIKLDASGTINVVGSSKDKTTGNDVTHTININANTGEIGGLTNTSWDPDTTGKDGRENIAATEGQLQQAISKVEGEAGKKSVEVVKASVEADALGLTVEETTKSDVNKEYTVNLDKEKLANNLINVEGKGGIKVTSKPATKETPRTFTVECNNCGGDSELERIDENTVKVKGDKPQRITNVAPGEVSETSTDAVNGSQLHAVNVKVNNLQDKINKTRKEAHAGSAAAAAMANLPQAFRSGKSMISAAMGTYKDQQALAIGVSRISDNGKWIIKGSLSSDSQHNFSTGVGVGYQW